jgi:MHS family proline/betaine transporter-like MFS transporter
MKAAEQQIFTREQKEAVGVLSIGTFLEYFDLKLYIHMAVLLNALFFPPTDPMTASFLAAFAFCSSFIFRPLGGMLFGYIGDKIGRKNTIFITTFLMGASCFGMYLLPEYSKIGIWASIIMLSLRALQGMACLGEYIGAQLYISESIPKPYVYPAIVLVGIGSMLGGTFAIGISKFFIDTTGNWRHIFLAGSIIAFLGMVFRTRLRESNEFADANKRLGENQRIERKLNITLLFSYFFMRCLYPFSLYLSFAYAPVLLKKHGYDMSDILSQNLIVTIIDFLLALLFVYMAYKFNPMKILRVLSGLYIPGILIMIPLVQFYQTPQMIFAFQIFTMCLCPNTLPAEPIIFKYFPLFKRFRAVSITFALASAIVYAISSFGVEFIVSISNFIGLYVLIIPFSIAYLWGLNNFIKEEIKKGEYKPFFSRYS